MLEMQPCLKMSWCPTKKAKNKRKHEQWMIWPHKLSGWNLSYLNFKDETNIWAVGVIVHIWQTWTICPPFSAKSPSSPLFFIFFFFVSFSWYLLLLLLYHHNIGSVCHELHLRLSSNNVLGLLQTELSTTMMIITLMRMRMMGRTSISPRSITGKWPWAIYLLSDLLR